ncbi:vWA domain-containing protein [Actinoplanes sp. NPDC051494]|uniref:vWA domain-containing protein n=1 Tax=Actinoplanes sp. NPDC051494 TaxID=3363907 RepID=UPI003799D8C2
MPRDDRYSGRRWLLPVAAALTLSVLPGAAPAAARDEPATLPAMQVVVLVDESGSLSDTDVVKEREAARTIAFSVLAPGSVVSVVGFGSSDRSGQSAVDVACSPTVLDSPQARDALAECVGDLHRRTPAEGDDTDQAAALQQALSFVRTGKPERKVVFLLTDGKLDVPNSPAYGDTAERRNAAAAGLTREALADLAAIGAQVWPLGFGAVDDAALKGFATGTSCTPAAVDPEARIARSSGELTAAVAEAFSSAGCVKYGPRDVTDLRPGEPADLHIDIPTIASDASIVVYKHDPRVQVEYFAPGSDTAAAPAAGGSAFEFAGQSTDTESLRVSDPVPGRWTIRLSSAEVAAADVAATVVYQAAVKAVLTANPPRPEPGQDVGVEMQVWARGQAVTDKEALRGLTFVTALSGDGMSRLPVPLADPDGDGTYTGTVRVPESATGALTFRGQVSGVGIGGDTRTLPTRVQPPGAAIKGQILFDVNRAGVHPGGEITGTVAVTNDSGRPARLRLLVAEPSPGAELSVDPAEAELPAGPGKASFTLRVGPGTPEGVVAARLRLVVVDDPAVAVAERLFAADVTPVPGWWDRFFWWWMSLIALLGVAVVLVLLRVMARNNAGKVGGLTAELYSGDTRTADLVPEDRAAKVFRFVLYDDGFNAPLLQPGRPGEQGLIEVRRAKDGLSITTAAGRTGLAPGARHPIGTTFSVVIQDDRHTGGAPPSVPDPYLPPPGTPDPFVPEPSIPGQPFGYATGDPFAEPVRDDPNNPFR